MTTFIAAQRDLTSVRFAWSPAWETNLAVRVLIRGEGEAYHRSWHARVASRAARLDLSALHAVNPLTGAVPDFLAPPPSDPAPSFADQLERISATPLAQVERELRHSRTGLTSRVRDSGAPGSGARGRSARARGTPARSSRTAADAAVLDELVADPAGARSRITAQLQAAWDTLVAPYWPRLRALLDADIGYRAQQFAARGLRPLLEEIDTRISWDAGAIEVNDGLDGVTQLRGRGLLLMPSAYVWPLVTSITDEPWLPTIVYPARGIAGLWQRPAPPPGALIRLLGRTRARLLASLDEPASTTALAALHGLSPSGTSGHLIAMRDAGLLTATRHRHEVRYARTRLGTELSRAAQP